MNRENSKNDWGGHMRVAFLGSLCVIGVGGVTDIRASQQRTVLVTLATQARGVVPVDILAEAVWGAKPPNSWRDTLRNLVRRLRATLGADSALIRTASPGYLLNIAPEDVDMLAFEALHKSGLAAAQAGDWPRALQTLTRATDLWRGTPFTDVPSALLRDTHLPYLEDKLIDAHETRISAAMRLVPGSCGGVVPELRHMVTQYPAHERFRWLLMLALVRSGRQGEAFAVYRDARQYSVAELGVEPGLALRELNQRILTSDESLLASVPALGAR
jgi:DNA-binding SARP family transcriptional activator